MNRGFAGTDHNRHQAVRGTKSEGVHDYFSVGVIGQPPITVATPSWPWTRSGWGWYRSWSAGTSS